MDLIIIANGVEVFVKVNVELVVKLNLVNVFTLLPLGMLLKVEFKELPMLYHQLPMLLGTLLLMLLLELLS